MRVKFELMGCCDCLLLVANGEVPHDDNGELEAGMRATLKPDEIHHLCCGDSDKDDEFSWSPCECCGSRLGGSRHHMVVLEEGA